MRTEELTYMLSHMDMQQIAGLQKIYNTVFEYKTDGFPARTESKVASGHENDSINAFLNFDHNNWSLVTNLWQSSGTTEYLDFFLFHHVY